MPASLRTGHVGINVTDLDRSVAFYRDVLGLQVLGGSAPGTAPERRVAQLGKEGTLLLTIWQQAAGAHERDRAGLHHLAFEVDTVAEVREAEWALKERGATFQYDGVVPHGEGRDSGGVFFSDPDGTRLEVFTSSGVADEGKAPFADAPTCGFF
ncbi:glyoxalase/bleomycin resistance protein/dioxygenase superfamily protein [Streptomyces sp. 846.5]|nr:VOC family protein [Streptomyces sp. 846.5]TDU02087.1 glyoxalase/bleomycin resistance protein/dioxygenase superfamily protein [Streptomyces sp. 846.5]